MYKDLIWSIFVLEGGAWLSTSSSWSACGTQTQWLCHHSREGCQGTLFATLSLSLSSSLPSSPSLSPQTHSHMPSYRMYLLLLLIIAITIAVCYVCTIYILYMCTQDGSGKPTEIHVTAKKSSETTKPKAFIHWFSAPFKCTARLYDRL